MRHHRWTHSLRPSISSSSFLCFSAIPSQHTHTANRFGRRLVVKSSYRTACFLSFVTHTFDESLDQFDSQGRDSCKIWETVVHRRLFPPGRGEGGDGVMAWETHSVRFMLVQFDQMSVVIVVVVLFLNPGGGGRGSKKCGWKFFPFFFFLSRCHIVMISSLFSFLSYRDLSFFLSWGHVDSLVTNSHYSRLGYRGCSALAL